MNDDAKYMARALQLARLGAGHTSPNPMVGAVIVADGRIIGEGFHRCCGQAHAEVNAINSVRAEDRRRLADSTIYVSLEPCSHYGKTPPCADLIVKTGIKRAVVATLDPFEKVAGRGVEKLRKAGVDVTIGVREEQARELNRRFFTAHENRRPWVQLKWAQSTDGFIARDGARVVFSTPLTTCLMHRRRALVDAALVGARTVAIDDPSLTVRDFSGRSPLRVVLDRNLSIPAKSKVLNDGRLTLIYNEFKNEASGSVEYAKVDDCGNLKAILSDLYKRGVTSLMVEGGASVLRQFIEAGLWDEKCIETAPVRLHNGLRIFDDCERQQAI